MFAATVSPAAVTFFELSTSGVKRLEALPLSAGGAASGSGACSAADWLAAACVLLRCQLPLQLEARGSPSFRAVYLELSLRHEIPMSCLETARQTVPC